MLVVAIVIIHVNAIGFAERKLQFIIEVVRCAMLKHNELCRIHRANKATYDSTLCHIISSILMI
jgi:hypothetical protein